MAAAVVRGAAWAYWVALCGVVVQWPGLFGPRGLNPVENWVFAEGGDGLVLRRLLDGLGVARVDVVCELLLWGAAGVAMVAWAGGAALRGPPTMALLWLSYLALQQVGRTFLSFQWDILLLEVGFLAIPASAGLCPRTSRFAFRWLLFKLMFMSGVVKLQSQCPTWLGLTALEYHYATQCLPTPLAWFAHQLPPAIQRLSVAATLVIEIPCALFLLSPFQIHLTVSFALQVALQVLIALTGNYNFFNALTVVLCLALLPGESQNLDKPDSHEERKSRWLGRVAWDASLFLAACGSIGYVCLVSMFTLQLDPLQPDFPVRLHLQPGDLDAALRALLPGVCALAALSFVLCALADAEATLTAPGTPRPLRQGRALLGLVCSAMLCATGLVAAVPLASLDPAQHFLRDLPAPVMQLYSAAAAHGGITYPYGLFRRMTGVHPETGTVARPELVLEVLRSGSSEWEELEFPYKPGAVHIAPVFMAPYQPRLDWQMWFAALGTYQNAPWVVHLADKILDGEPDVLRLIDADFELKPPVERIRGVLYDYDFTRLVAPPSAPSASTNTSNWWWRRPGSRRDYLPEIGRADDSVARFLDAHGLKRAPGAAAAAAAAAQQAGLRRRVSEPTLDRLAAGVAYLRENAVPAARACASTEAAVALLVVTISRHWVARGQQPPATA